MKILNFFGVCVFFTLAVLVSLLSFGGCGDREDPPSIQQAPLYPNSNGPPEPQVNRGNSQMRMSLSC